MNLEHKPHVAQFLQQLGSGHAEALFCPICGKPVEIVPSGQDRISALCSNCDFHASVLSPIKP